MSLVDKAKWKRIEELTNEAFSHYLGKIDVNIEFEIDKPSFENQELNDLKSYFSCTAEAIQNVVLKGDDEKDAVTDGVKKIIFSYGTSGEEKSSDMWSNADFSLEAGTLKVNFDFSSSASSVGSDLTNWLMNHL